MVMFRNRFKDGLKKPIKPPILDSDEFLLPLLNTQELLKRSRPRKRSGPKRKRTGARHVQSR